MRACTVIVVGIALGCQPPEVEKPDLPAIASDAPSRADTGTGAGTDADADVRADAGTVVDASSAADTGTVVDASTIADSVAMADTRSDVGSDALVETHVDAPTHVGYDALVDAQPFDAQPFDAVPFDAVPSPDASSRLPDSQQYIRRCGDGVVDDGEECDDGDPGAGPCLDTCLCAPGFASDGTVCADIDECATDNGGCGHPVLFACSNNLGAPPTCTEDDAPVLDSNVVTGSVSGLASGRRATVILGNDSFLESQTVEADEPFAFENLPNDTYFLSIDAPGYSTPRAKRITIAVAPPDSSDGIEPVPDDAVLPVPDEIVPVDVAVAELPADEFSFHWEEDASRAGHYETAYVNNPPVVEFLDEPVDTPDLASAETLLHDYNIILSDEDVPWNQETAYRLLDTMRSIPQTTRSSYGAQTLPPSKWILTDVSLQSDIAAVYGDTGNTVTLSLEAFVYATPKMVLLDGVKGKFFSKRLHHALVHYVTRAGEDTSAVERILDQRYGCTTTIPDYSALTAPTTGEDSGRFQQFHPLELVEIINMFEEMPQGYHVVPGLRFLVRRKDGMRHPIYPEAPAVAWAWPSYFPNGSYIEFMDSTFTADPDHMHRLIIHEKAHFLWAYLFSDELREEWTELGGWYENPDDPDGWSTTKTTEFVTAYAHAKNPNEDMAESLSYFVLNPDGLRSRSLPKFELIRDRVMHGNRYIARIREDLTFQVLNLYPDYAYPGKIRRVDIRAAGAPTNDKTVIIEIELHTSEGVFDGASLAYLRLHSPIGTFLDVYLAPVDSHGTILRGEVQISRFAKSGYWTTDQIVITDLVGNQRFEGVDDYGWKLHVDNPLEDTVPPRYVPGSLTLNRYDETIVERGVEHSVQLVQASWLVDENQGMPPGYSVYAALSNPSVIGMYALESWGFVDSSSSRALVSFYLTDYRPGGVYGVPYIMMVDTAGNRTGQNFSESPADEPLVSIPITTTDADTIAPEVSLNDDTDLGLHRILVHAEPTNPEAPDGETLVNIQYQARDDKSGVGVVWYRLLDPQGISHHQYHYHDNFYTMFFDGDPTSWAEYEINVVLPVGSPPGTWGLQELVLTDKAGNRQAYNFVEIVHFVVE
ncbi:MAG: hypothetical protein V2A73_08825 [Pseudomonadota bacterium]